MPPILNPRQFNPTEDDCRVHENALRDWILDSPHGPLLLKAHTEATEGELGTLHKHYEVNTGDHWNQDGSIDLGDRLVYHDLEEDKKHWTR